METIVFIFVLGCTTPACEDDMFEAIIRVSDPDLTRTWEEKEKFSDLEEEYY
jgi:hypothetical protein